MVVVAAFESCSRPLEIKKFLYLDFIDRTKRGNVWIKLEETISKDLLFETCVLLSLLYMRMISYSTYT